jgi:hypothetical protein
MKKFIPAIFVSVLFLTLTACESKFAKPENCVGADCEAQTMKVDAPIISPNGGSHPAGTPIAISSSTGGAKIIYTVDGSEPKASEDGSLENGVLYQSTVPLNVTKIRAIAIKEGMEDSEITESNYSVTAPNSPTFNPDGGTYNLNTFPVSLVAPAHGCDEMRYTKSVNNNEPSEQVYSNPVDVTATNTTIGAVCIKAGISSPVSSATYTLKVPTPSIKHVSCSSLQVGGNGDSVISQKIITCTDCLQITNTMPSTIQYRYSYVPTNQLGSNITKTQWSTYSAPIICNNILPNVTSFTIEFKAENTNMTTSDTVSQQVTK